MLARAQPALDRVLDPLLAAALLALGAVEVWLEPDQVAGPRGLNTAFLVLVAGALVWRRRRPLAVVVVVTAGVIAWNYALYLPGAHQPPLTPLLALLLALFTAAAAADRPSAAVVGLCAAAWAVSEIPALAAGAQPAGNIVPAWIFAAFAVGIGRVVHRQRELSAALADRATQLEAEREEKARLAVALERTRIARELHDVVTHDVSVMVIQAGVERRALRDQAGSTRDALATIEETGRQTLVELRRLLGVLRRSDDDPGLAPQPTLDRLGELADQVREAGLPVALRVEGDRVPLPAGVELSAYRIVQEALTNALKHAGPAHAEILIRYAPDELVVDVRDDGHGPRNGAAPGHGLLGMRERVALHHGALEAGGHDGGGFRVHARLPLEGARR
jgi:signal transduction histidine kinase